MSSTEAGIPANIELPDLSSLTRTRHPGVSLLPLRPMGTNGPVVAAATGQVIRPFAAPEDDHALLDRDARVAASCPGPGSPDTLVNKLIMPRVPG
jgi:hypothetical protein